MTRDFVDSVLKDDVNGDISDHLRNHIHLTNCVHLKNHMHKHSPVVADRAFMRDLIVLHRSKSLRDPSATPRSWHSASVAELLANTFEDHDAFQEGRRSVGNERYKDGEVLSYWNAAGAMYMASSKVVPDEAAVANDSCGRPSQRIKREETSKRILNSNVLIGDEEGIGDVEGVRGGIEWTYPNRKVVEKDINDKLKGKEHKDYHNKSLSDQLNELGENSDSVPSSQGQFEERSDKSDKVRAVQGTGTNRNGVDRARRRKFTSARRSRATASRDFRAQNSMPVALNSVSQTARLRKLNTGDGEELSDNNVSGAPRNGCGIPWNWSIIHHRSRDFLNMAGRSLSCGLADPRLKRAGMSPQEKDVSMPIATDQSDSPSKSDGDALPLLVEAFGSQVNSDSAAWVHDYSGELGIYSNHNLKRDLDSDYTSEARSGDCQMFGKYRNGRHQSLTQKYLPRTFKDLVGQHLVAQALSNDIAKRKVGFLYVFYGPHGTGKTSCARIFARALNCQSMDAPRPCGFCHLLDR
ncbi:unnamed protein product [Rhodiola kirilowii]